MTRFEAIPFAGSLRPSQRDAAEIARRDLEAGRRRIHVVAPPGSGKTVLGLYLWAQLVRRPALVLSPNSAIQVQWAARTDLFELSPEHRVSTDPEQPGLLTSLTYQSVTLPRRGGGDLDAAALLRWEEQLVLSGEARDPQEAQEWIADLARHNPEHHRERLAIHRKQERDDRVRGGEALEILHGSSRAHLERLVDARIGLVILDECHHLMGHWGRVLAEASELFDDPVVVGLTATPPDRAGLAEADTERYDAFFGPVDHEVPIPAVVKEGHLAPFQDLVHFVRPTAEELDFVASADRDLRELVAELCRGGDPTLLQWVEDVLRERRLAVGTARDWADFERADPALAHAAPRFLLQRGGRLPADLPRDVERTARADIADEEAVLVPLLDRYVRRHLRRSPDVADHARAERVIARLRLLGVQITEQGARPCASPIGRVLAYSRAKALAVPTILCAERLVLGRGLRAVVITDFERSSAVLPEVAHLLDEEAGGAVAVFRALLADPDTDTLDPVLMTGSSILVDDDLAPKMLAAARADLGERGVEVTLRLEPAEGFSVLVGEGARWSPRIYVEMVTALFQQGLTRCLVGTRGLLGEGWDASKVNVLIDLTSVTTSMSINQLRGRSFRLDRDDPGKLADNWDVVCVAPEFTKGLDDYRRFQAKHRALFGVTDDGVVEKGVGHVHAAFTEIRPEGIEDAVTPLNAEMLTRPGRRAEARERWAIGEPYDARAVLSVEIAGGGAGGAEGFPPGRRSLAAWNDRSLVLAVGRAVLGALQEAGSLPAAGGDASDIEVRERAGGYLRVFLRGADGEHGTLFGTALAQALGPLEGPRYVIPRHVEREHETWISRLLPRLVGRYFVKRRVEMARLHAVPDVLADHKERALVYQRHWNLHVSPGEALFAHRGAGADLLERSRREGRVPMAPVHSKEIFP